jgi:hypothetical protein
MGKIRASIAKLVLGVSLVLIAGTAAAEDISGTIVRTLLLSENSRLVGHVTCTVTGAPCIAFGAPGLELRLNGFFLTGQADPTTGCSGGRVANEFGISTNGQNDLELKGPGVVQRFRADGVLFVGTVGGRVERITATTNCTSGIRVAPTSSQIRVESNVSVRNGSAAPGFPCGGI